MQLYAIPSRFTPDELDTVPEQSTVVPLPARETMEAAETDPEPADAA